MVLPFEIKRASLALRIKFLLENIFSIGINRMSLEMLWGEERKCFATVVGLLAVFILETHTVVIRLDEFWQTFVYIASVKFLQYDFRFVYKTEVGANNGKRLYYGASEGEFKTRYNNHTKSFRSRRYCNESELSKYIWKLKDNNTNFILKWSIASFASPLPV